MNKIWITKTELRKLIREACKCNIEESEQQTCDNCGNQGADCDCTKTESVRKNKKSK